MPKSKTGNNKNQNNKSDPPKKGDNADQSGDQTGKKTSKNTTPPSTPPPSTQPLNPDAVQRSGDAAQTSQQPSDKTANNTNAAKPGSDQSKDIDERASNSGSEEDGGDRNSQSTGERFDDVDETFAEEIRATLFNNHENVSSAISASRDLIKRHIDGRIDELLDAIKLYASETKSLKEQVSRLEATVAKLSQSRQPATQQPGNSGSAQTPAKSSVPRVGDPVPNASRRLTMPAATIEAPSNDEQDFTSENDYDEHVNNNRPISEKDIPSVIPYHDGSHSCTKDGKRTSKDIPFSRWLDKVLTFADDSQWSHANRRLCIQMRAMGTLDTYIRRPDSRALSFGQLIHALVNEFCAGEELRAAVALSQIRQRPGVPLSKFNQKFDNVVSELSMTESQKVIAYLKALLPEYKQHLTMIPKTLTLAYDYMKSVEALQSLDKTPNKSSSSARERSDNGHRSKNGNNGYSRDNNQSRQSRDSKFHQRSHSPARHRNNNNRDYHSRDKSSRRSRSRDRKDSRSDNRNGRDSGDSRDARNSRDTRDSRDSRDNRDKFKRTQVNNVEVIDDSDSESNDSDSHSDHSASRSEENSSVDE